MNTKQRAALAILANRRPSAELAALADLVAMVDVIIDAGAIDGNQVSDEALEAFSEARDRAWSVVTERLKARGM